MPSTYSGDPGASDKDYVRFLIGDTSDPFALTNEEILAVLDDQTNVYLAAAICARALASKYTKLVDKTVGDLSISYSQAAKQFWDLANQLENKAAISGGVAPPLAGGISIADKELNEEDSDIVQPRFKRGMHDNLSS